MTPGPSLVAITLTSRGDGVAVVAGMLHRALSSPTRPCRVVSMFDGPAQPPSLFDKIRFAIRLALETFVVRPEWMLFSHVGLVRAQKLIPPRFRRPYAVFLHGVEAWRPFSPSDRAMLRHAKLRLANSSYTARRVMDANPDIGDVVACPLAIDERRPAQPAKSAADVPAVLAETGAMIVLMVGGLRADQAYKGHDQMIAAWSAVVDAIPKARLLIVGDGDDRPRLERLAQASAAAGTITFTGFATDAVLADCYNRAALFAMPSRGEGFGIVYVEAMARGLPCIGSIHDAAGDVIADNESGLLVDQSDIPGLARAVASLLADDVRRAAMSRAARARVEQLFTRAAFDARISRIVGRAFESGAAA
jgi:phosphatidylinositol alpha-1,6-mannosyltransferase